MIHASADVDPSAVVAPSATVWHLAQVREGAVVGEDVVIGRGAYIGSGVEIEDRVKIQNYALIYEPARIAEGAFIGPAVVLTNDRHPRSVNADGSQKNAQDWTPTGVTVGVGASLGARAVCVAPVAIGRWAMVAAGAVVVHDVPDFALVAGVPARRIGWVGVSGAVLGHDPESDMLVCPVTGDRYSQVGESLIREPAG